MCLVAVWYVLWYVLPFRLSWSFNHIERNAKKVMSGAQLQSWAMNLIAQSSTNSTPRVSELGTNFPGQLLRVFDDPPFIKIHKETTNSPANICLLWGGGIIGHCGFDVGSTNFVSNRGHKWKDGGLLLERRPTEMTVTCVSQGSQIKPLPAIP
jgi:hypothetical protein